MRLAKNGGGLANEKEEIFLANEDLGSGEVYIGDYGEEIDPEELYADDIAELLNQA